MENSSAILSSVRRRLTMGLAVSLISIFLGACYTITVVPGNPGAQVQTSGWVARRYLYSTAWASVSSLSQINILGDNEQAVMDQGYVTTDKSGQARVRMGSDCTVYVFQNSASAYSGETISTCEKSSAGTCNNDLNTLIAKNPSCKISVQTIPSSVTFDGTVAIILEFSDLESIVILMPEGKAIVTPTGKTVTGFEIPSDQAAYVTTDTFVGKATSFFGFPPGAIRPFGDFVKSIQDEGRVPQVQRSNLLLLGRNLPLVPVPDPYQLSLRWFNLPDERIAKASEAIARYIQWGVLMDANQFPGIPLFFQAGDQLIDLRSHAFSQAESAGLLAEVGFSAGQGIVIGFDASIPNLGALATAIQLALKEGNLLNVTLEPYDPRSIEDPFLSIDKISAPVIILGGY